MDKGSSYVNFIEKSCFPIDHIMVARNSKADSILNEVMLHTLRGWPAEVNNELKAYESRKHEIYVEKGCVIWGHRIIIPTDLRKPIPEDLHTAHLGIVKSKSIARSYFWRPKCDNDIEEMCKSCHQCQEEAPNPQAHTSAWPYPNRPFERIHADFFGPLEKKMYLVIIDAYSKWLEVIQVPDTSSYGAINVLRQYFCRFGLPNRLVTDNGTAWTSENFKEFMLKNGVKHITGAPFHPATNGAAENAV